MNKKSILAVVAVSAAVLGTGVARLPSSRASVPGVKPHRLKMAFDGKLESEYGFSPTPHPCVSQCELSAFMAVAPG
jgi:hypothetical protein